MSLDRQIKASPGRHLKTSLGRQIGTSLGRSNRIFGGRPGHVGRGRLREVLGTNICRLGLFYNQPPELFCKKRCSCKFLKIYRKTPVQRFFLNKDAGQARTPFLQTTSGRLLLLIPHKTAHSSSNIHNAYKNADGNSKFI